MFEGCVRRFVGITARRTWTSRFPLSTMPTPWPTKSLRHIATTFAVHNATRSDSDACYVVPELSRFSRLLATVCSTVMLTSVAATATYDLFQCQKVPRRYPGRHVRPHGDLRARTQIPRTLRKETLARDVWRNVPVCVLCFTTWSRTVVTSLSVRGPFLEIFVSMQCVIACVGRLDSAIRRTPPAAGLHTTTREPKRAHLRVRAFKNISKIQREDLQEIEEGKNIVAGDVKKREMLSGPAEGR